MGHGVVLVDHDAQASSSQWHQHRPTPLPAIHLIEAHRRAGMYTTRSFQQRLPRDADRIVIDTPSAVGDQELDSLLRSVDAVIVPLLPSSIDIRAGTRFIRQLLTHRAYRTRPIPVAVVANRVRPNSPTHLQLLQFLDCLDVPAVATFCDSPMYTTFAEEGTGIFDLETEDDIAPELLEWRALLRWIDGPSSRCSSTGTGARRRSPRAAAAHPRLDRSALVQ